jgi:protein-disulfide isomerase
MEKTETSWNRKPLTALAILALIGVGLALQLTVHYYDIRSGMAGFKSFCNVSAKMNCDAVAASPYAEFASGLPLSSFAVGWYLALFAVALIARNRFWRRESLRVALLMTSFGLLLSLGYLSIMAFRIQVYCLFCLLIDVVGLLSLACVFWAKPDSLSTPSPETEKWKKLVGVVISCLIVAVVGLKFLDSDSIPASEIDQRVNEVLSSPVLPVDTHSPSFGPSNAPVTIVEFSDFQCPYCRIGAMVMNTVLERYPNQVRVVFKPFPLDASCNRMITQPMHLTACEAARTALCAEKQGKFADTYETLFDRQTEIVPGMPGKMAAEVGVDSSKLEACVKDPEISQAVSKSIEEGIQLGVQSTPTFFINGHKMEGFLPGPFWTKLIDKLTHGASASNVH